MEDTKKILETIVKEGILLMVLSSARKKEGIIKVKIEPYMSNESIIYMVESFSDKQAFHKNIKEEDLIEEILSYSRLMRQLNVETRENNYSLMFNKKGRLKIRKKENNKDGEREIKTSHNKEKNYILKEGMDIPFLKDLNVFTKENKISHSGYDKFKQVNRFLEFISDVIPALDEDKPVKIIDFGCGKSYLTFAVYYYFTEILNREVHIKGLDLKKDVIEECSELARKYAYKNLSFEVGDIKGYEGGKDCDMVITLHACDTATDYAIDQAVKWGSKVILSVPCCQHELNKKINNELLNSVLSYGLLKDRFSAILTDALRAELLKSKGYDVQILEFIDMVHTPKNLLIRAIRTGKSANNLEDIRKIEKEFNAELTLSRLLSK